MKLDKTGFSASLENTFSNCDMASPNMVSLADTSNPPQLPPMSQCTRVQAGDNTPQSVRSRVHLMLPDSAYQQYLYM